MHKYTIFPPSYRRSWFRTRLVYFFRYIQKAMCWRVFLVGGTYVVCFHTCVEKETAVQKKPMALSIFLIVEENSISFCTTMYVKWHRNTHEHTWKYFCCSSYSHLPPCICKHRDYPGLLFAQ